MSAPAVPPLTDPAAALRFGPESAFAEQLAALAFPEDDDDHPLPPSERPPADRVRRRLLSSHVRLSANMAPEVFDYAEQAASALGLTRPVEIYQAAGDENAANWTCAEVVFVSLRGSLMSLLDRESFVALLGHEFGHHLAHTDAFPGAPASRQVAMDCAVGIAGDARAPDTVRVAASRLAMAKEFTADRFAALAAGGLDGPLRLMMTIVTGLPAERLRADRDAYLAQAQALFGEDGGGETEANPVGSHPEHLLRVYALALFAESDAFQRLTGQGPGTRPLAEVDAALERILVGAGKHVFEAERDQALPPEFQEFALCAASLMANADGDLDEDEARSLEETFANVLGHWRELLVPERALARFDELLPLAVSGGEPVAAGVFNLLVHVMLADREVHVRELETLAAVGRSLRQEALFDSLLAAVTRAVRLARSETPVERPLPALPPGRHEAQAALAALFAGLARRGGGAIALSRLLRIMGKPLWEAGLLPALTTALAPHALVLAAPPTVEPDGSVRGEQSLQFSLNDQEQARREAAIAAPDPAELTHARSRDALVVALKHLRERLVSGDGRSPSVRLYRAAPGRHFDLAALDRVIDGRSERIVALLLGGNANVAPLLSGEEAGRDKAAGDLARAVRNLDREFRARVEETGTHDLFVGYPFLVGNVGGFFVRAPLILHPFSPAGDGRGGAGSYSLKRRGEDAAVANQALIRLLFAKRGYAFNEELANDLDARAAEGPEPLLEALRQLGLDARPLTGSVVPLEEMNAAATTLLPEGVAVSENAVLGFFPQSSSDLLQDYDELLGKLGANGDGASLEQAFNAAADVLPAHYRPPFPPPPEGAAPEDRPVIYADPSQRAAVLRSRHARLMVMDGPPGTGKSQTIVNLVADELARGGRVAIVCEKRVALDVVKQRLDGAGLGHLAVVVHDVYDDRKALYRHLADRLEAPERRAFDPAALDAARTEATGIEAPLAARERALAGKTATGLSLGSLHTVAAGFSTAPALSVPGLEKVAPGDLPRLVAGVRDLRPHARFWAADSAFRAGADAARRRSMADASPTDLEATKQTLRAACDALAVYERLYALNPLPPETLEASEGALQTVVSLGNGLNAPSFPELPGQMLALRLREPGRVGEVEELFADLEKHRRAAEAETERVTLDASAPFTAALAVARQHAGSFLRFLFPSWHKARRTIRETLLRDWPERASAKVDAPLLAALDRRAQAARAWTAAEGVYRAFGMPSRLPRTAGDLFAQAAEMLTPWQATARLAHARPALEGVGLWPLGEGAADPAGGWPAWAARGRAALELLGAQRAYFAAAWAAAETFPQVNELSAAELARLRDAFAVDAAPLAAADRLVRGLEALLPAAAVLPETLADALPADAPASAWTDAVQRAWAEAHLAAAEAADPALAAALDAPPPLGSAEAASARLLQLHGTVAREESARLAAAADRAGLMAIVPAEARARRTPEQTARENLIRECRKQRNVTPLRTLVRRTARAGGLLDVAPVWLMSPETTAILFPREPVFDLLIVDEASQCTVENGLPVLTRARRAVIAGDEKQMPPSSFFKAVLGLDAESAADGPEEPATAVRADAFESESLLVLARGGGSAAAPLRWHYRALFEELIAFSNHSMYGGSLLTIPATVSRSAPPAVRWVRVTDGTWDAGSNVPEARRIVDLLGELLARPQPPSVGVVTFNLSQRRTVLDEIDARRAADPEFARVFDVAASAVSLDARPFVKNLESVQGDERDVILFSLGYAPVPRKRRDGTEETYVPARFGPLGQKGGERRLNVAVSRAKSEIIVVASFDPAMLSVAHTKHDGPRLFKAFVEFARHLGEGRRQQAEKILSLVNVVDPTARRPAFAANGGSASSANADFLPLHHQIGLALEAEGFPVETMIGTSEFRLPVAVVRGDDPHRYALAIVCDDGTGDPADVYENYVHVPNVLAHRRWRYLRVNARDWHRRRGVVLEAIRGALAEGST